MPETVHAKGHGSKRQLRRALKVIRGMLEGIDVGTHDTADLDSRIGRAVTIANEALKDKETT